MITGGAVGIVDTPNTICPRSLVQFSYYDHYVQMDKNFLDTEYLALLPRWRSFIIANMRI